MEENLQAPAQNETVQPDTVEALENLHQETQESQQPAEQPVSSEQKNFAALRKAKELAERERDEYYKRLQEVQQQQEHVQKKKETASPELGDDDLAEGRHLKELRSEINAYKKQVEQTATEARIKSSYPDFDSVVTPESVERLKTAYPELAATLASSSNLYNTASSTYTLIKKLGIYEDKQYDAHKEVVQKNMAKPRPLSSVSPQQGESPLSHANAFANGLTEDLKQKLYREMVESRRSS